MGKTILVLVHRLARWLHTRLHLRLLARLLSVLNRFWTGVEIHPGTNAVLLGPIRVGDHAKIGANAFVINRDVPPGSTVVGSPARIVKLRGERVDLQLPRTVPPLEAEPVELEV